MADKEKRMLDIQRGSIVNSKNKTVAKDNWCMVLGCMENHDTFTAVRLTDDQAFKDVLGLKVNIDSDIFGKGVEVYANPFAILNLKVDWISDVRCPVPMQDYYGVVSTITNYFMGFLMKTEDGHFAMDIPYLQNPLYPIMMGMVNINQAHDMEINSRIKMAERRKKKEEEEEQKKITSIKKVISKTRNTSQPINIIKQFDELGVYKLDTQKRIEAIFAAFDKWLAAGERLSIPHAYEIMFNNRTPSRMHSGKSAVTKEQFAYIMNANTADIVNSFGIVPSLASGLRRKANAIFTGKRDSKITTATNSEVTEFIKEQSESGLQKKEIIQRLKEHFKMPLYKAKEEYAKYIHNGDRESYIRPNNNVDDRLLNILDTKTFKCLKDHDRIINLITEYSSKATKIHDGSLVVDSGDTFIDILVTIAIEKSINSWKWFEFLYRPECKHMAAWLDINPIGVIANYYQDKSMPTQSIVTSAWFLAKIVAYYAGISNDEKLGLLKICNGESNDPNVIDIHTRIAASNSTNVISKNMKSSISNHLGFDISRVLEVAESAKYNISNLPDYDEIKRILISK